MDRSLASWPWRGIAVLFLLLGMRAGRAAPFTDPQRAELQSAIEDARRAKIVGPASIPLLDQAVLSLPEDAAYIPEPQAARYMRAVGNVPGPHELGLVVPRVRGQTWFAALVFSPDGHVSEDDAARLDPDGILASLRRGNDVANGDRAAHGYPELELSGWLQPPVYDKATHHLVWSVLVRTVGDAAGAGDANYNIRLLGREGVLSLDMVAAPALIPSLKPEADALAADIAYKPGKRYSDFSAGSDRVAAYGLAGLIGVVAAKKLGLIALGAAFFAKFAKVIALATVGMLAAARRLVGRKGASR